jgi:flavin reductase (DIM6/NTAB) family NADH-FMN oxidoreductase RutF
MSDHTSGLHAVSRELFVRGMRQVASSVAVVTTNGRAGRHGATVSAFSSVSADPPQLLVCLRSASRIAAAVDANGSFCLNILSHRHPHVAERFSGTHDSAVNDRFEGIDIGQEGEEWVVIKDSTAFACTISDRLVSSTHTIFLGHVQRVQTSDHDPLTYLQGRYRRLAQQ